MYRSREVEIRNLDLRLDRHRIQTLIRDIYQEGHSLYWSESEHQIMLSVRNGRELLKLVFLRLPGRYRLSGDYVIRSEKLAGLMERLISDTKGHAVVKRLSDRQVLKIENIVYGELIRLVEVYGMEHRITFQKRPQVTIEDMVQAFKSTRAEQRAGVLRLEIDYELAVLFEAIAAGHADTIELCKHRLQGMRTEMLMLEI